MAQCFQQPPRFITHEPHRTSQERRDASQRLAATTSVLVNIGIDRPDVGEATWSYFYDQDIFFTRISYPHRLSPNTVPAGASSIQCEVYYSEKYRPMDRTADDCIDPVIEGLRKCGLLRDTDTILHRNAGVTPFANIIFDPERAPALELVHGYLDDVGYLYVVDRKKELILVGGFNVYPREIDEVLYSHEAVHEAAAVGIADDFKGEVVKAFVALVPGADIGEPELIEYCAARLIDYKVPVAIDVMAALPKTGANKIDKLALRGLRE